MLFGVFVARFGDEAWNISFSQAQLACTLFTIGKNPLPVPVFKIALNRLPQHFARWAMLFLCRGLYFR